jgi:glutamine cyclotransferase
MKTKLLLTLLAGFAFTACSNSLNLPTVAVAPTATQKTSISSYENASAAKTAAYDRDMRTVGLSTREDPKYKSFGFKTTEEKVWFRDLTYSYWHRDITRSQFVSKGLKKYPSHSYEFNFVANGFLKV